MRENLKELWRFRELLFAMAERELRIRYKNSFLGFFWSLLNPLATVVVMTVVFQLFLRNSTPNFSAYVLAAYLPFLFINMSILDSAQSVLTALPVVKKVYFPREILPLASVISNFVHFLLAMLVFFVFLFGVYAFSGFVDSPFTWRLWFLPVLVIITLALVTGTSLLVSALNVFYEDVKYMVSVLLYLLFFLTPIMYFSENVVAGLKDWPAGDLLARLYHANPLAMLATTYKRVLLPPVQVDVGESGLMQPLAFDWLMFGVCAATCVGMLFLGYAVFNRMKWRFVERP